MNRFDVLAARLVVLGDALRAAVDLHNANAIGWDDLAEIRRQVESELGRAVADFKADGDRCYVAFSGPVAKVYHDEQSLAADLKLIDELDQPSIDLVVASIAKLDVGKIGRCPLGDNDSVHGFCVLVADPSWIK